MAKFAETYPDREFVQQVVVQTPWGHNIVLLDKVADMDERKWYIKKSAENGWNGILSRYLFGMSQSFFWICWSAKLLSVSRGRHFEKRAGQSVHWFASVQKQKQCGRRIFAQGYFKADWCKRI